ncbi:ACP S-malonyltransferase [Savagea faecisuis]|uniref:Malonyl CoA-acyl carrier protein transacylase n=1 Tax=Savagea faecisuis TaxID=1274803 RepID=A0ABW3GX65_9BACL
MKLAFIFPGQGAQQVGMGTSLIETNETSATLAKIADEQLPFSLTTLMKEGPQEVLTETYHTQPALLTVGTLVANELMQRGVTPDYVAGHSLGEYTALVAANVMSFEDGVRAVYERGRFMEEAVPNGEGAMAAVLGADRELLERITQEVSETAPVQLANLNCPGQIVISGSAEGVALASERLKEEGIRRVMPLAVSGPFHSSLMERAADQLRASLTQIDFSPARFPLVANVNAQLVTDGEQIREQLVEQLYSPVLWEDSMRRLIDEEGVTHFIECGPGKVLAGLMRKIDRNVTVVSVSDRETMEEAVRLVEEWKA